MEVILNYVQVLRIALHIGFWCFLLFFAMRENIVIEPGFEQHYIINLTAIALATFLFYPLLYLILPLIQSKKFLFAFCLFILYYFAAILLRTLHIQLVINWSNHEQIWVEGQDFWKLFTGQQLSLYNLSHHFFSSVTSLFTIIFIPLIIKFIRYAYRFHINQSQLHKENMQMELNFLKSQVNPHLFFNTLNNLQSFIIHDEKNKSIQLISRLADFMRFTLYECNSEFIALTGEVELIRNYIEIESVRYDDKACIEFTTIGNIDRQPIPALLLMPLVENAFKHGMDSQLSSPWVSIHLELKGEQIQFSIQNSYCLSTKLMDNGGIGLENVKKRLGYYFPNKHQLCIVSEQTVFSVSLIIDFSK